MPRKRMTRREFLFASTLTTSAALLAACGTKAPPAPTAAPTPVTSATEVPAPTDAVAAPTQAPAAGGKYSEAPMLAEKVKAGTLPPVDQRLPENPLVIEPEEEVGQYGGTWHWAQAGYADWMGYWRIYGFVEPFLKYERHTAGSVYPNVLESWDWNDDSTVVTLHFRKGMKWSDGEPLTANDFLFYWNDMVLDETVKESAPRGTRVNGELMKVDKVDDYTLTCTFVAPNPLFLYHVSKGYGSPQNVTPAHYLKKFHPKYNKDLKPDDVQELLNRAGDPMSYPDMPSFAPWQLVEVKVGERAVLERNPYYWKVDSKGNQLPYLDRIEITVMKDAEVMKLKAIAGEVDAQFDFLQVADVPMLKENQEAGDYRLMLWPGADFGYPLVIPGYDYEGDPAIRELIMDKRFRQALSWAINRERINQITALGLATPRQAALSKESPEFQTPEGKTVYDAWASSYAAHEPETAKKLLDEIGLVDANGDGWRERPDGTPLELVLDVVAEDNIIAQSSDLIKEDWEAVGLKTVLNATDYDTCDRRAATGERMFWAYPNACAWGLVSAAGHWAPVDSGGPYICPRMGLWYETGGEEGVAPPKGSMLEKLQQAYSELIQITDPVARDAALLKAYQIHIDEGPINIGVVADHPVPVLVKNNFRNVPTTGLVGPWDLGFPGTSCPEQFFIKS